MKTTNQIFRNHNNSLIPEKGSEFEYVAGITKTDMNDELFECKLVHVLSEDDDEYINHLFI